MINDWRLTGLLSHHQPRHICGVDEQEDECVDAVELVALEGDGSHHEHDCREQHGTPVDKGDLAHWEWLYERAHAQYEQEVEDV